jgi:AcrR family transcriptional regulator
MPYAADHKDKTRARIVDSARVLFNRHGFESVSIDDVMKRAGLTRGGFYHHFSSKESLYAAAVSSFNNSKPGRCSTARAAQHLICHAPTEARFAGVLIEEFALAPVPAVETGEKRK